jgi:hypothetical protein
MFAHYPEFSSLNFTNRTEFEQLIVKYPPISDLSFATLMIWWNFKNDLVISTIGPNLIIYYRFPRKDTNSGLCLIGTEDIDKSIDTIFNTLATNKEPTILVHVPEFVINSLPNVRQYHISEEEEYNEYLYKSDELSTLQSPLLSRTRRKVNRFVREAGNLNIQVKSLDLSQNENQEYLLNNFLAWKRLSDNHNDPHEDEVKAIKISITKSVELEVKNMCIYVNEILHGFALYHISPDGQYVIVHHIKVQNQLPHVFDYAINQIASLACRNNIPNMNLEMDLGIEGLRRYKSGLRPVAFFKKYTITPV